MKRVVISLPEQTLERLKKEARQAGKPLAAHIRFLLRQPELPFEPRRPVP